MAAELDLAPPPPTLGNEFSHNVDIEAREWLQDFQQLRNSRVSMDQQMARSQGTLNEHQKLQQQLVSQQRHVPPTLRDRLSDFSVLGFKPLAFLGQSLNTRQQVELENKLRQNGNQIKDLERVIQQEQRERSDLNNSLKEHMENGASPEVRKRALEMARDSVQEQEDQRSDSRAEWEAGRRGFEKTLLEQAERLETASKELGAMRNRYGEHLSPEDRAMLQQTQTQLGSQAMALRSASAALGPATRGGMGANRSFQPPGQYQRMLSQSHNHHQRAQDLASSIPMQVQEYQQQQQQQLERQQHNQEQSVRQSRGPRLR